MPDETEMLNVIKNIFAKTSLVSVLVFAFLFAGSLFSRAQAHSSANNSRSRVEKVRVIFPFDNAELRPDYLSNDVALSTLDAAIIRRRKIGSMSASASVKIFSSRFR